MNPCFECGREAVHNHHVIPKVYGGTKTVRLCGECHGRIHGKNFTHWRELQRAGIETARAAKVYTGGKAGRIVTVTPEKEATIKTLYANGTPKKHIAEQVGVSRPTVYRVLGLRAGSEPKPPGLVPVASLVPLTSFNPA